MSDDIRTASPWRTLAEAAPYAKKSKRFLLREIHEGRLRAARIGGKREVLTRAEWIDQWISDQAKPIAVQQHRRA